ncbi:hypothetical protein Taro_029496, partial [Colocasia esculenta]|nr:hypothetical protein [Colocasia esculenta]
LCAAFLSRPGCPSRSGRDRSTGHDSVLSCCDDRSSDACLKWQTCQYGLSGCRGACGERVSVAVGRPVALRSVTRRGRPTHSGCRALKAQAGYPFPFFPLSPLSLSSGGGEALLRRSGVVETGGSCGVAERRAWSEEEVANRREGPLVGSFFVKGRDFLCPSQSGQGLRIPQSASWLMSRPCDALRHQQRHRPGRARPYRSVLGDRDKDRCRDLFSRRDRGGCRDAPPRRVRVAVAVPFHVAMVASLRSVTEGDTFVAASWKWRQEGRVLLRGFGSLVRVCLADDPLRVCACLSLAGLVVCYEPAVRRSFCGGCPASSLFAQCSALEGLSHLEVVSVSWDPHPREPVEGVLQTTSVLELAAHFLTQTRQSLSHCLSLRWFRSHVVVLGVRPQLGQAAVLRVLGGSVSPFAGAEVGARLARRGLGRRVPLLAASGGGLVVVVVTAFPHDFRSRVPVRGGTNVCGFPTSWHVQGPEWFCVWALNPVEV